jgi:Rps23 Pro-64 3,4-dihydroxylase Tpa1-like proline 4-hydroxylase
MNSIVDNKISISTLKACIQYAESAGYIPLHPIGDNHTQFKFSHHDVEEVASFKQLWEEVKQVIPNKNYTLHRSYINAMVYGQEDSIHTDDMDINNGLTVIVYLTNSWFPEWFGQTVFFESASNGRDENYIGADITNSVLPKYNRFVIFDKNTPHCVAPISKRFTGVRLTCMFKLKLVE